MLLDFTSSSSPSHIDNDDDNEDHHDPSLLRFIIRFTQALPQHEHGPLLGIAERKAASARVGTGAVVYYTNDTVHTDNSCTIQTATSTSFPICLPRTTTPSCEWLLLPRSNMAAVLYPSDFAVAMLRFNERSSAEKCIAILCSRSPTLIKDVLPDRQVLRVPQAWQAKKAMGFFEGDDKDEDGYSGPGSHGSSSSQSTGKKGRGLLSKDPQSQQQSQPQSQQRQSRQNQKQSNQQQNQKQSNQQQNQKQSNQELSNHQQISYQQNKKKQRQPSHPIHNSSPHSNVVDLLSAPSLWKMNITGAGVRTAIFDTGLRHDHPSFRNIKERTEWTSDGKLDDGVGHGTFVAGIVASTSEECPGFAPDAELHIFRVFTSKQLSYTSWFLDAFNYAIHRKIHIINLSIGGPDFMDRPFVEKVWELSANGIVLVSAIGNDGPVFGSLNNPADQIDVIGVGGIDFKDSIAPFSSRGMTAHELPAGYGRLKPDVVAYSMDVRGLKANSGSLIGNNGACRKLSGTSVASPVVTGALTLASSLLVSRARQHGLSDNTFINPATLKQALVESAVRVKGANIFEQGSGKLNLLGVYEQLSLNELPRVSLHPSILDLTDCPYMWPYCTQPLFHSARPSIFNITILNGISVSSRIANDISWKVTSFHETSSTPSFYSSSSSSSKAQKLSSPLSRLLNLNFQHSEVIWPWSGWLAVSFSVPEFAADLEGYVDGFIELNVESFPSPEMSSYMSRVFANSGMNMDNKQTSGDTIINNSNNSTNSKINGANTHNERNPNSSINSENKEHRNGNHGKGKLGDANHGIGSDDKVRFIVDSNGRYVIESKISLPFRVQITKTPHRKWRILWDQYHNLRYPPGYFPRDTLGNQAHNMLDWHGDHPHTNFRELYNALNMKGYFVEVLGEPWTCFNASLYGTLIIADPEEEVTEDERVKLIHDVEHEGLSLLVLAEWYSDDLGEKIRFFDENTRQMWSPLTGGANLPALNRLLEHWGIAFGDRVWAGTVTLQSSTSTLPSSSSPSSSSSSSNSHYSESLAPSFDFSSSSDASSLPMSSSTATSSSSSSASSSSSSAFSVDSEKKRSSNSGDTFGAKNSTRDGKSRSRIIMAAVNLDGDITDSSKDSQSDRSSNSNRNSEVDLNENGSNNILPNEDSNLHGSVNNESSDDHINKPSTKGSITNTDRSDKKTRPVYSRVVPSKPSKSEAFDVESPFSKSSTSQSSSSASTFSDSSSSTAIPNSSPSSSASSSKFDLPEVVSTAASSSEDNDMGSSSRSRKKKGKNMRSPNASLQRIVEFQFQNTIQYLSGTSLVRFPRNGFIYETRELQDESRAYLMDQIDTKFISDGPVAILGLYQVPHSIIRNSLDDAGDKSKDKSKENSAPLLPKQEFTPQNQQNQQQESQQKMHLLSGELMNDTGNRKRKQQQENVDMSSHTGRIVAYGDSGCFDSSNTKHQRNMWFLLTLVEYAAHGTMNPRLLDARGGRVVTETNGYRARGVSVARRLSEAQMAADVAAKYTSLSKQAQLKKATELLSSSTSTSTSSALTSASTARLSELDLSKAVCDANNYREGPRMETVIESAVWELYLMEEPQSRWRVFEEDKDNHNHVDEDGDEGGAENMEAENPQTDDDLYYPRPDSDYDNRDTGLSSGHPNHDRETVDGSVQSPTTTVPRPQEPEPMTFATKFTLFAFVLVFIAAIALWHKLRKVHRASSGISIGNNGESSPRIFGRLSRSLRTGS